MYMYTTRIERLGITSYNASLSASPRRFASKLFYHICQSLPDSKLTGKPVCAEWLGRYRDVAWLMCAPGSVGDIA